MFTIAITEHGLYGFEMIFNDCPIAIMILFDIIQSIYKFFKVFLSFS